MRKIGYSLAGVQGLSNPTASQAIRVASTEKLIVEMRMIRFQRIMNDLATECLDCVDIALAVIIDFEINDFLQDANCSLFMFREQR